MFAHPSETSPGPAQTSPPAPGKRKRPNSVELHGRSLKVPRQIIADAPAVCAFLVGIVVATRLVLTRCVPAAAETQCELQVGNDVISCFPTADIVVPQHQWVTFVCAYPIFSSMCEFSSVTNLHREQQPPSDKTARLRQHLPFPRRFPHTNTRIP
jgi:hypothetical protein